MPLNLLTALTLFALYSFRRDQGISAAEHYLYLFLVGLVALYGLWWLVTSPKDPRIAVSKMPRGVKVGFACFMLTSGLMLLMTLGMLPFSGVVALKVLLGPLAPILLVVGAFTLVPFVQRRLQ